MAKNLGTFQFAANFQVKAAEALDPRMVASSKADLINKANWPSDGDTIYVYNGLIVDCGSDGVYRLIDASKALNADYSGWERIDAGGINIDNIFTYKGNVENYESLPTNANTGDVYNVETEFTITTTSELGGESIVKTYLAGTNVAWNGNSWDPLAGSIDLSLYATKTEVSEVRTNAATNAADITKLSEDLGKTNEEVAKKVDAVEGSSLISSDKLALIDTNASDIEVLKTNVGTLSEEDTKLSTRIATLENLVGIEEDGTPGENASLETRVSANESAIDLLKSDNTTNKTNIGNLQASVNDHESRIAGVVALNAQQTTDITGLSNKVSTLETGVQELTTTTGLHTTDIANIKTDVNDVKGRVTTIEADYLKAADISGKLDASVYEAKISELELADSNNLQEAKNYADGLKVTIDAAYAQADAKTLQDAKDYADSLVYDDAALEARVKANEDALLVLNGADTVDGSVANQVNAAINKFASDVTNNETIDTFKELVDYAASHNSEYATLAGTVQSNTTALEVLNGNGAGSVAKAVKDAVDAEAAIARAAEEANANAIKAISDDYLKAEHKTALEGLITAETNRATGVENAIDARLLIVEGDYSALQLSIDSKVDQSAYNTKIAELEQSDADTLQAAKDYTDAAFEWMDVK